jgi:hypothetical protein
VSRKKEIGNRKLGIVGCGCSLLAWALLGIGKHWAWAWAWVIGGCRQDFMATPGNFGGGSTGPDQIFWA